LSRCGLYAPSLPVVKNKSPETAHHDLRPLPAAPSALLDRQDLLEHFRLSRDLSGRLLRLLPHVSMGRTGLGLRLCVQRRDLERCLEKAARERLDLVKFTLDTSEAEFAAWFDAGLERVAA
jgi:hypothetical protein